MIALNASTMDELKSCLQQDVGMILIEDPNLAKKVRDLNVITGPITLGVLGYANFKMNYRIFDVNGKTTLKRSGVGF